MAYDYYCMNCGKQLKQDVVLLDMQYLLTRSKEKKFQLLKFRFTIEEFKKMIEEAEAGESGYYTCQLSFEKIMQIIANSNNLGAAKVYSEKGENDQSKIIASDADIAALTLEDIDLYIKNVNETFTRKKKDEYDPFADDEEEMETQEVREEYKPSAAILALEAKDETNTDRAYTKVILRSDLEILRSLFIQDSVFVFRIKEESEKDDEGREVLVGYNVEFVVGSGHIAVEARVCNKCGAVVFSHAGTAKHQAVAFIGYQGSGKTSAILALTHYAENHMMYDLSDMGDENTEIWRGSQAISKVASVEVVDKNQRLKEDLKLFRQGIAPAKTLDTKREDAYSATLRIKNKAESKYYLFTLTDLPGELCRPDGTVKKEAIYDRFPVALSCDAFVICFDTREINAGGDGVASGVLNVCKWADAFQKMRADHNQVSTYVPTMLLFTKCKDLEEEPVTEGSKGIRMGLEDTYILKAEKERISSVGLYNFVCEQFNQFGQLHMAYHAMMRCSPYGYKAPSSAGLKDDPSLKPHIPTPKNIDQLMRWLMSVAGCIPTEAEYRFNPRSTDAYRLNDYCIRRPQLRSESPMNGYELQEALARCALFENPGKYDREYVKKYDSKAQTFVVKWKAKLQQGGNADGGK